MTTLPLALVFLLLDFVQALEYNVTVDDQDPRIAYSGSNWTTLSESSHHRHLNQSLLQNGTSHSVSASDNGATFNFTGSAVWVKGVLSVPPWGNWQLPNVTFNLDGVPTALPSSLLNDAQGLQYNVTLFQASGLSDISHLLSIQTHDSSLFILDSITYATTSTLITAVNSTDTADSDSPESTFPYGDTGSSGSSPPHAAIVGGVIGGIFGAFLLAGLVGLLVLRRSKQKPRSKGSRNRKPVRGAPGGSGSGGSSGRRQTERDRQLKRQDKAPIEFNYSGPKPVDVPWIPPVKGREMPTSNGDRRSGLSTYASSAYSEGGRTTELYHAMTTDSPHPVKPQSVEWGGRPKTEKHHSTQSAGSTLDAEGVLEHVMNHSPPPDFSTRSPTRYAGDHPFRAN